MGVLLYLINRGDIFKDMSNNDKFKFEIKKANDMKERLSDVKGLTEITGEINDLINMIKNSKDY